ncbi:MAG: T9SS type A sorting domain-containing protein, partial [Chitinophagales bacterium]|nr:T9SS type A sorting domain-containing protein [Chitinophagales bacterium]
CTEVKTQNVIITASAITGIPQTAAVPAAIRVYPNPNSGAELHVELQGIERADMRLVNAIGEVVYKTQLRKGDNVLPLAGMAAGVYQIEVNDANLRMTERLVIGR